MDYKVPPVKNIQVRGILNLVVPAHFMFIVTLQFPLIYKERGREMLLSMVIPASGKVKV